ncbi:hypothetical protein CWS31_007635 [Colwellia echini]|uniref:Glycine zipper domain-containing protein n=2 Tax=Colwellia echini TaxID=1982103 RepID=A0ABY3MY43_9GAMM|nr:hypothetical protein CWS31_007635 [Colwellia echini]
MNRGYDRSMLEGSLSQMESAAMNFAHRFINDGKVRMSYINQTKKVASEYRARVTSGAISAEEAAKQVQVIRNQILEAQRLRTSDLGKAKAINLKKTGLTLTDLTEKYSQNKYGKSFLKLSSLQKNQVYLEIIDSSGRPRPAVNSAALKYSKLGRGLLLVTLGVAVYNIAVADDKPKATAREGVVIGGGFAGGAAGGALAGLACGPGAPICVTVGVFVGGALGALGADVSFGWFF